MFYRKDAVSMAVLGLLACAGIAVADTTDVAAPLSIKPSTITADAAPAASAAAAPAPDRAPLMGLLDKAGAAGELDKLGIDIHGFIELGYYANLRNNQGSSPGNITHPSPFTQEVGNHLAFNQLDIMISRQVASDKFDVGGAIEMIYGTDANYTQANGMQILTPGDNPGEVPNIDFVQMYVDVNLPVGNGLKIRAGRFVTLLGYEYINPTQNPFYSHSYTFNNVAFTQTGILGFYTLNEQWAVTGGITRGWDQFTEDNNSAVDFLGQVAYTPSKTLSAYFTTSIGPQDPSDSSHYRITIDPTVSWKVTDRWTLGGEFLYNYDGGKGGDVSTGGTTSHAYGDSWGIVLYAAYNINEYLTLNLRGEKFQDFNWSEPNTGNTNYYEGTIGLTITPMPKDALMKNLMIRPEFRYDWSEDSVFATGNTTYQDRFSLGLDIIFKF